MGSTLTGSPQPRLLGPDARLDKGTSRKQDSKEVVGERPGEAKSVAAHSGPGQVHEQQHAGKRQPQQHCVGRALRDVRNGADVHADSGLGQRNGVVGAVAAEDCHGGF